MIKNRQEILFLYDVTDANPNGDPLDENKPRMDEETSINIVTDVRLKRNVRDYLFNFKGFNGENGKDIFVRETASDKGGIKDGKARALDFLEVNNNDTPEEKDVISEFISDKLKIGNEQFQILLRNVELNIIEKNIDVRLFGATIPIEIAKNKTSEGKKEIKDSITFTGPVQFNMGRSLHKVSLNHIKGTGAFASTEGKSQSTFREEYFVNYSMIAFHGIINENAAKHTKLTDEDVLLLDESIWNGTKNLITRSKMGHMPRLLMRVVYKEGENFFIGGLQKSVSVQSELPDEKLRSISDYALDVTKLMESFVKNSSKIEKVRFMLDDGLKLVRNNEVFRLEDMREVKFEKINF